MTHNIENKSNENERFIQIDELTEIIGLSPSTVYKMTSSGEIPHYKPFGKKLYFKISEVYELFEKNKVLSNSEIQQEVSSQIIGKEGSL